MLYHSDGLYGSSVKSRTTTEGWWHSRSIYFNPNFWIVAHDCCCRAFCSLYPLFSIFSIFSTPGFSPQVTCFFPFSFLLDDTMMISPFQRLTPTVCPSCLNTSLLSRFVPDDPSHQSWVPLSLSQFCWAVYHSLLLHFQLTVHDFPPLYLRQALREIFIKWSSSSEKRPNLELSLSSWIYGILKQNGFVTCKPNFRWYMNPLKHLGSDSSDGSSLRYPGI